MLRSHCAHRLSCACWRHCAGVTKLRDHPKLAAVYPYFEKVRLPDATNFDIRCGSPPSQSLASPRGMPPRNTYPNHVCSKSETPRGRVNTALTSRLLVGAPGFMPTSGFMRQNVPCSGMQCDNGGAERAGGPCGLQPPLGHYADAVHGQRGQHRGHDGARMSRTENRSCTTLCVCLKVVLGQCHCRHGCPPLCYCLHTRGKLHRQAVGAAQPASDASGVAHIGLEPLAPSYLHHRVV